MVSCFMAVPTSHTTLPGIIFVCSVFSLETGVMHLVTALSCSFITCYTFVFFFFNLIMAILTYFKVVLCRLYCFIRLNFSKCMETQTEWALESCMISEQCFLVKSKKGDCDTLQNCCSILLS